MVFRNRNDAATLLTQKLLPFRDDYPLILGIPRGAVPMAREIAERLPGDFDVVLVHKISAPDQPEFAIGSVSEFGTVFEGAVASSYAISKSYFEDSVKMELAKLKKKRAVYSPVRAPIDPTGRTVIIIDDGIATGATMLAAIRAIRPRKPKKIIVAAPIASQDALDIIQLEADECVVLEVPSLFFAISQFYESFPQVSDEEVVEALSQAASNDPPSLRRA